MGVNVTIRYENRSNHSSDTSKEDTILMRCKKTIGINSKTSKKPVEKQRIGNQKRLNCHYDYLPRIQI